MLTMIYLVPIFAVFGIAAGQTSLCSQATATISSQADATALASCSTVSGSVEIASTTTDPISLDGIQHIKGDLKCLNAVKLTSLSGKDLTSIGGSMNLTSLTTLFTLAFPQLATVNSLQWIHLNALQQLSFGSGITSASSILISDTQLNSLDGINLSTIDSLDINNNPYLEVVNSQISSVTKSLNIVSNGQNLKVAFPNLTFSYNMTLGNITSLSFPSLTTINTTLGFYGNTVQSILAPNLTSVGDELAFVGNPSLANISMPALQTIVGGFTIAQNAALLTIDGFSALKTTGAIVLNGTFSSVALPSLGDCRGSFELESSGNVSCSAFDTYSQSKVIKGQYICHTGANNAQPSGSGTGTSTGTGTAPTPSPSSKGAHNSAVNLSPIVCLSILASIFMQIIL